RPGGPPLTSTAQRLKAPTTKSDRVAVGDCDDRVSARKLEKQPPPRPSAVRSTPSSRNSPAAGWLAPLLFVYDQGTLIAPPLTIAAVLVGSGMGTATGLPVASSPVQRKTLIVEVEPPWVNSLTGRMSPSTWLPRKGPVPLPLTFGLSAMLFRKNQKPAVASPLLSKRS